MRNLCRTSKLQLKTSITEHWRSEAKCRPGPTIKMQPFLPLKLLTRIWNERRSYFVLMKYIRGNQTLTNCKGSCFSLSDYDFCLWPLFSLLLFLFFCFLKVPVYAYMDQTLSVKSFPCWLFASGKLHYSALIVYSRVSQLLSHGRIFDGSRPGNIEIEYFFASWTL